MRGDMLVVFVLIGRVDAQEEMIVGDLVDQDVVDESAVLVQQARIMRLADLQLRRRVGRDVIDQFQRLRSANFDLAHVADVEQAHAAAARRCVRRSRRNSETGMSQPPKSTILAPMRRWVALSGVVLRGAGWVMKDSA